MGQWKGTTAEALIVYLFCNYKKFATPLGIQLRESAADYLRVEYDRIEEKHSPEPCSYCGKPK